MSFPIVVYLLTALGGSAGFILIVLALLFKGLLGFGDNVKQANETPTVTR